MHKSQDVLIKELDKAYKIVKVDGLYEHYKNPKNIYKVLMLVIAESDSSISVIYEAQYGAKLVFERPLSSWIEKIKVNGKTVNRFTYIKQAKN